MFGLSRTLGRFGLSRGVRVLGLLLIAIGVLTFPSRAFHSSQTAQQGAVPFQKGISYSAWWAGQYTQPGADLSLDALASTGADWISLIVTAYQDTYTSTSIDRTGAHTPTDGDLVHAIEQAHSRGLKVMLKPHVDLNDESNGHWRGHIGDGFETQAQWSAWFASYRSVIEHYAALAQAHGADQFCIGTELLGTTHREDDWRAIIAGVRAVYDGPIVYAALHSGEEMDITWWDAVDYIGVDGYYPLTNDVNHHPDIAELEAAWEEPKAIMADLYATYGKPILLTEIGYRSHHGCANHPFDSNIVSPLDLEEQLYAYEAAFRQLHNEPWLGGMFWWQWHADRFISGPCNDGFSPYQKPAEGVLRAWYGGDPLPVQPALIPDYDKTLDIYTDGLASGWADWSWNATLDLSNASPTYEGDRSISAVLGPWGAISPRRSTFTVDQYRWLEFYVRGPADQQPQLVVFFDGADGTQLPPVPVNDCRHISGGTIEAEGWKLVRIPLETLNPSGLALSRLSIQNKSDEQTGELWVDGVRLVAAQEPSARVFIPLAVNHVEHCP
jgi:hypothetical protein